MTYLEAYLASLYDKLERGGTQTEIDRTVDEVNNPTRNGLVAWLASASLHCATCGEPATPVLETVQLLDEVMCTIHRTPPR